MRDSEALDQLRLYLWTLQKYRSATAEELPSISDKMKASINNWIFGEKAEVLLITLSDVIDRGSVEPMQYYNLRMILWNFTPEIIYVAGTLDKTDVELPEDPPDIHLALDGWSDEARKE